MPVELTIIIAILGAALTICNLIMVMRNIKRSSPSEALKQRQDELAEMLDNDNRRLKRIEDEKVFEKEFYRVVLKSLKGILNHMADGDGSEKMKSLAREIDNYLIER